MITEITYLPCLGKEGLIDLVNYCIGCENAKTDLEVYKRDYIKDAEIQYIMDENGLYFVVRAGAREYKISEYNMSASGLVAPYATCSFDRELRSFMVARFGQGYINGLSDFLMKGVNAEIARLTEEMKKAF